MNSVKNENSDTVSRQTLYMFIAVTFVLGFLSGIVFTSYKNTSLGPSRAPSGKRASGSSAADGQDHARFETMLRSLEKEVGQNPENISAWIQIGNLYFDHGENEKAIPAYEKAIAIEPDNANVLTDLGVVYRRAGNPQKAVEFFERAVAAEPNHKTARFNKGVVLMHDLDKKAEALRTWKELAEREPLFTAPGGQSLDEIIRHYEEHK